MIQNSIVQQCLISQILLAANSPALPYSNRSPGTQSHKEKPSGLCSLAFTPMGDFLGFCKPRGFGGKANREADLCLGHLHKLACRLTASLWFEV